jgi:cation transport regulator ChaC
LIRVGLRRGLKRAWVAVALRIWPLARLWYRGWGLRLDGAPDDAVWYFAYGANMADSVFLERRRMQPMAWRVGRIRNYRLRFNLEGRPKGRAAPANISSEQGATVWGVLYSITRRELVRLNASEGIPGWRYRPLWLQAEDALGNELTAVTYIAEGNATDGNPSLRYITLLRAGARAHGLPAKWISFLDGVEASK